MTILDLLNKAVEHLRSTGITNPKTSCEILLAHTLGMRRLDLYLNYDLKLNEEEIETFRELYRRRMKHEPLAYILGETEFMSLPFNVNPDVLIPRPETELLVEKLIEIVEENYSCKGSKLIDIGTGSGNIAISLAHFLPDLTVEAVDNSVKSLETAKANAALNNLNNKIVFQECDILTAKNEDKKGYKIIVSNPPYVGDDQRETLEKDVIEFEPHGALFSGEDKGLFYRKIAELGKHWLDPNGMLAFEIGFDIGELVAGILEENGYNDINVTKDYAGHDRIVTARL